MKLPQALSNFLQSSPKAEDLFVSLVIETDAIQGGCWRIEGTVPRLVSAVSHPVHEDSWEEREAATGQIVSALKDRAGGSTLGQVILGLPSAFLTADGDILSDVKSHLKKITSMHSLHPMGFVSLHQAIVYKLKNDEGVPPSVILLGVTRGKVTLSLYKVGNLVGQREIELNDNLADSLEQALKEFKDVEILPSRIFLYGTDSQRLARIKSDLLKHPWQTRASFLHFPKIDFLPPDSIISAVSFAGATEFVKDKGLERSAEKEDKSETDRETHGQDAQSYKGGGLEVVEEPTETEQKAEVPEVDEDSEEPIDDQKEVNVEVNVEKTEESEASVIVKPDEPNVVVVSPDEVGFDSFSPRQQGESVENKPKENEETSYELQKEPIRITSKVHQFLFSLPSLPLVGFGPVKIIGATVIAGVIAVIIIYSLYYLFAGANITLFVKPKIIDGRRDVIVDPTSTSIDSQQLIIPGKKKEQQLTTEKTIPTTGKKKVGDPAKGSVTIYNKTTTTRTFKKGTVIRGGELAFTLDDEVKVASASESVGSLTFGKAVARVTAGAIGASGNVAAGTEFSFKDTATSVAVARNDQPFTGGTSRDITVVARVDNDSLVKEAAKDLVERAKTELSQILSGKEKFIDETITTTVAEKQFQEELDQEAAELHGTVTMIVSGVAYDENELISLFSAILTQDTPTGYAFLPERTKVLVKNVQIKKDGKITMSVEHEGAAIPTVDQDRLRSSLVGKSVTDAKGILESIAGIMEAQFGFNFTIWRDRLPPNARNIKINVVLNE